MPNPVELPNTTPAATPAPAGAARIRVHENRLETSVDGGVYHHLSGRDPVVWSPLSFGAKYDGQTDDIDAHERMFDTLRDQGYPIDRFLALYERIAYGVIEKIAPHSLALAATAAAEHFTAIMAENALRMNLLQNAHPTIRALLHWHAAEEVEHRSVAFDVLNEVAPGYGLRMAGLAVATVLLAGFWIMATSMLLASDPDATAERIIKDFRLARQARLSRDPNAKGTAQAVFLRGIREYMRPDFHPSQSDIDHLAEQYLTSVGMA